MHLARPLVSAIIVIDNSSKPLSAETRRRILAEYGDLSGIVRFVRNSDLGSSVQAQGWWSQQALKLMVSDIVETERYVVLDAKNHLVFPLGRHTLESEDGRARIKLVSYEKHVLRPHLERVLAYMDLDVATRIGRFTQTTTPFVMYTAAVRSLIARIRAREGKPVDQLLIERQLTEFFLYIADIIKNGEGLDALYATDEEFRMPMVWRHTATRKGCLWAIAQASEARAPFLSVRWPAMVRLNRQARAVLADYWVERGLYVSREEGMRFILDYQAKYPVATSVRAREVFVRYLSRGARSLRRAKRLVLRS
jgi:hypothetical protein